MLVPKAAHFEFDFIAGASITLLNQARELVPLAFHLIDFVIGELSPLFLDLPLELGPHALAAIFIQGCSPNRAGAAGRAPAGRVSELLLPIAQRALTATV